ncbi:hypothetical protein [Streptomyces sp. 4N124]|uniref:hypothetical protein n=1 Tax=Streptomyces sp. 4N124 TaxID=3457420 RepID=UPI003FD2F770
MQTRNLGRAAVAACAAGVMSVMAMAPASATGQASVYIGSVERARVNYWTSTDDFRVSDTSCDDRKVYAQYQRAGAGRVTLHNTNGCGTNVDYYRNFTDGQSIKYRACVNIGAAPDRCGPWKWDTTG